eukprot:CAMPEP_0182911592 /NCGR_PEP_ID=MMETSP0034_2-20130328/37022_1 /TAXON_ID=156128 /ORGANISM="Nephroselmis pyriformis, Strain CCMP717" /LENGTH=76 /DNA_ID=CAMNT_0025048147 /DNA_START=313 /DNA_END=540 /DNA_ORIENTATION=-
MSQGRRGTLLPAGEEAARADREVEFSNGAWVYHICPVPRDSRRGKGGWVSLAGFRAAGLASRRSSRPGRPRGAGRA